MSRTHYVPIKYSYKKTKPMNTQLTIEEKKLRRGGAMYSFTKGKDHYQVIELFEKYR